MRIRGEMMGEQKVSTTIRGIKVNAVVRWQGLNEKIKNQFNEELARAIVKGDKKWVRR